ncbi:hypothetical protein QE152_g29048 [Popillia japonica]|uniref:Uncharacterized protein n=1 Tax=Popillia japonica TaxID=7064 RepID=A0AAW1JJ09_POPJA
MSSWVLSTIAIRINLHDFSDEHIYECNSETNSDEDQNVNNIEERITSIQSKKAENIQKVEAIQVIRQTKKGESAGHDKLTPEKLKNLGAKGIELLTAIFNKALTNGRVPDDWKIGIQHRYLRKMISDNSNCEDWDTTPIFKKDDK